MHFWGERRGVREINVICFAFLGGLWGLWGLSAHSDFPGPSSSSPSWPSFSPLPRNGPGGLERKSWGRRREKTPRCLNGILFELFLDYPRSSLTCSGPLALLEFLLAPVQLF